jgi:hypothetical protein
MRKDKRKGEILDLIDNCESGYSQYESKFQRQYDNYLLRFDRELYESLENRNKSRLFIPMLNAKIKRIYTSFQKTYFTSNQIAKIVTTPDLNKLQNIFDDETQKARLFFPLSNVFLSTIIAGTGFTRTYWNNGLTVDGCSVKDVKPDPNARTWGDIKYITHEVYLTADEIKRYQRSGVYTRDFDPNNFSSTYKYDDTIYKRVKLIDVYCFTGEYWKVSTVYDKSTFLRQDVLLRDGQPFDRGILIPQLEDLTEDYFVGSYGEPSTSASINLQHEINIRRNQQIDAIARLIEPPVIVPSGSGINYLDILRGKKAITAQGTGQIFELPRGDIRVTQSDIEKIELEVSDNTGVSPQQNGVAPDRDRTATEASILSEEGNIRIESYIRSFNESLIEPLAKRMASLVWKYSTDERFFGIDRSQNINIEANVETGIGATNPQIQISNLEKAFAINTQLLQQLAQMQDPNTQAVLNANKQIAKQIMDLQGLEEIYGREEPANTGIENINQLGGLEDFGQSPAGLEDPTVYERENIQ